MQIQQNEQLGIQFKGFFDDRDLNRLSHEFSEQIVGNVEQAIALAKSGEIDFIYIALPMSAEKRIMEVLNLCSDTTCTVSIIPNFFIYNLLNARWQKIGPIQTLSIYDTPFQGASNILKRTEALVFSLFILCLIAIPMLCIAAAVKFTSPGPIIFKQKRYGLDGKDIKIYKFRSMSTQDNGSEIKQAIKNDLRITPLGAFLRKTSLDELPQFINVLQGRMSIVGPRPHAVAHNEEYRKLIEGYMLRHKVRPGITGWAQINGFRGETETVNKMVKRVEFDLEYIHRWSVWLDVKIILATVFKGFINKNAY
jgi:putative colanic acid biosynthesis UDP-glucose lipid carrier transferase